MRYLFTVFIFLPSIVCGQSKEGIQPDTNLYFPAYTFDCFKELDFFINQVWSETLFSINKKKLLNDQNEYEFYRLLYEGKYGSIVEIYKLDNKYIVRVDSSQGNEYLHIRTDTITIEQFNSLDSVVTHLWDLKSNEPCATSFLVNDDRDSWVIEIKRDNQYLAIERKIPELYAIQFIHMAMRLAKLKGYGIYYSDSEYKEY